MTPSMTPAAACKYIYIEKDYAYIIQSLTNRVYPKPLGFASVDIHWLNAPLIVVRHNRGALN
jgi:hypothetical protein